MTEEVAENTTDCNACDSLDSWDHLIETLNAFDVTSDVDASWCFVQDTEGDRYLYYLVANETRKKNECNATDEVDEKNDGVARRELLRLLGLLERDLVRMRGQLMLVTSDWDALWCCVQGLRNVTVSEFPRRQ